ncbi:calpain-C isoform X2 [Dendroctonus ponderosae]|uniref:Calpain catalytic domain-containing protein n=1 Tax=Dendroctonus ponderosae TaxID=77166 RepID=A0AAR5PGC2_DENPD|nr:calpain-C isoform X2 [Dendroctonus ponderosae]
MSEYEQIRKMCLKRGELWEDPDFPANQASVFYHQTPPFQFTWKRPKDLCPRPGFIQDGPTKFDISPGKMGDRWLVSCLGVLHLNRGLFYRVVPADQSFVGDQYCGLFRFRIWWCGEWSEVLVDDRLPTVHGRLAFLQSQNSDYYWPGLLEKAYAKLHGSYEALKYGSLLDGLADLTGGITECIPIEDGDTSCFKLLHNLLSMTSIVTCAVQLNISGTSNETLINGIQPGINYRISAIERVNTCSNEFVDLIILRNPMEDGEYTGPFAPDTIEWSDIPAVEATRIESCLQEQDFWMPSSEFLQTFTHLELVHLDSDTSRDEPSLNGKSSWQMRLYQGMWRRGVTAGGCRNNPDTFHVNPQLHLFLSEMEETVMSLNQHSVMEPKVIGFSAYTMPKMGTDTIGRVFFKKNKSLFNSQYTNSRQVSHRSQLEQGGYLIVPTTFEPGQESGFTLRVFSRKPLKLKLIDSVPMLLKPAVVTAPLLLDGKSFSQYEAVFLQLADEHRSVNAFELQELLDACLPNDYIKSCASLEVCRQIVFAFEQNGCTGRLKFSDFKDLMCSLKNWQTAFKNQTKEKTGILKAERFRDALLEVGFQMSSDVLTTLILRYMRKDGTLRFGDFVSAILHLSVAFLVEIIAKLLMV